MDVTHHFYEDFIPEHYDLFININREEKMFSGQVSMTGFANTKDISIHQKYLVVKTVTSAGQPLPFTVDDVNEAIHITLPIAGESTIIITYEAKLTDTMMGIYPSYYEIDGIKKELIGTQFETTSARQAFPSIDEPEAKATFDLAIKYDEHNDETILANMPEKYVEDGIHYFETTVKMSTYLVAFAFGELRGKEVKTTSGVTVGVYGTKAHASNEFDFALDIAKRSIEFYENYYQTPYPLPHSWQLGLPDFSAGAMENWGLITYREAYLLMDPANTSIPMKHRIATVIAHEVAHQWFGDLVTMKWWDEIWLNESFANMMEYVAIDALEPDWHIWEDFQTMEVSAALNRDATDGVQAVHVPVEDPAEIDSLFDAAIVYAKGARMLVMVRALIGDAALRQGLKTYFETYQYRNATGNDLWQILGDTANLDVQAIMTSWLEQPGYPVVTATIIDDELVLTQKQFFIGEGQDVDRQWQIPLHCNDEQSADLMTTKTVSLGNYQVLRERLQRPFRLNIGNESHFIVNYDATLLADILQHQDELSSIDQLQILQDLHLLAKGQQIPYADLLALLAGFAASKSAIVIEMLYRIANNLRNFVDVKTPSEGAVKVLFDRLSQDQVIRLGWESMPDESSQDQLVRPYVLHASLYAENATSIQAAHKVFEEYEDNLQQLPAAIRTDILTNEIKHFGDKNLVMQFMDAYRMTTDSSYKISLQEAITSTTDSNIIMMLLEQFKNIDVIKPQDLRAWMTGLLQNDVGQQLIWNWVRNNWDWLAETVGGDMEFTSYITKIADAFQTAKRLEEFKAFFEPKLEEAGLGREIIMGIKAISGRVTVISSQKKTVQETLLELYSN